MSAMMTLMVTLGAALALCSLVALAGAGGALAEAFTALVHVENAMLAERDLAADIRRYLEREERRLRQLDELASEFDRQSSDVTREGLERRLANPVSAYATVRDLRSGAAQVERLLELAVHNSRDFYDKSVITSELLPDNVDMNGAAVALLRLQDTYQIPTDKIVAGELGSWATGSPAANSSILSVGDCLDIGKSAYDAGDFYHAVVWFQYALEKMAREPTSDASARRLEVLDYLAYALWKQGNVKRALLLTEEILTAKPDEARVRANRDYYLTELGKLEASSPHLPELQLQRNLYGYQSEDEFMEYERLCRGETSKVPIKAKHTLKCSYSTGNGNPQLLLSPVKEEELNLEPKIVYYHQLVKDYEIAVIKNISVPRLHRSGVVDSSGAGVSTADYRTSKSSWLVDEDHTTVARLSRRIGALTGLSLSTVEPLQVLNYGIGGHYEPHVDFTRVKDRNAFSENVGNRLATFLNYLSDVPSGGATVFPRLGVAVWPTKGGAVFWYNLLQNGEGDERMMHAACPVLYGYKWVGNKWFHERGNEFIRPCSLDPAH